jgi:ketosteroid isomerase-like protein
MTAMATEHPNARRMREVADAVARGDVAGALEYFPEDVVWYWPAERKEERVYRGHDGLKQFFGRVQERSNGRWEPQVVDVLGSDEYVVIFLRVIAEYGDDRLDILLAHFATVGPGGFVRNWFLPNDVAAVNRFFGS